MSEEDGVRDAKLCMCLFVQVVKTPILLLGLCLVVVCQKSEISAYHFLHYVETANVLVTLAVAFGHNNCDDHVTLKIAKQK